MLFQFTNYIHKNNNKFKDVTLQKQRKTVKRTIKITVKINKRADLLKYA